MILGGTPYQWEEVHQWSRDGRSECSFVGSESLGRDSGGYSVNLGRQRIWWLWLYCRFGRYFAIIEAIIKKPRIMDVFYFSSVGIGEAVLGAWIILYITRIGSIEKGWLDRIGIALGCCWIFLMLVALANAFLS